MRIVIDEIERECQVVTAPHGAFCIWDLEEGCFGFPEFVIFAPAMTDHEKACGNIVICPVQCCNGGYESASPYEIQTTIYLKDFRNLVIGYFLTIEMDSVEETAEFIYDRFVNHGTLIQKRLKDYMANKEYLSDKELLEAVKSKR